MHWLLGRLLLVGGPVTGTELPGGGVARFSSEVADLREAQRVARTGSWAIELPSGRRYRSPEYLRLFGIDARDGGDVELPWDRIHGSDRGRVRAATGRLIEHGGELDETFRVVLPDGAARVIHARGRRERDPTTGTLRVVGTVQDVTEERRLREQLMKVNAALDAVLANSPTAIFVKDREQRFLLANEETARIMGRPGEDLVGKTLWELLPAEIAAALDANDVAVVAGDQAVTFEETAPHAGDGGREHTWLASKFPVRDERGELIGVGGISLDVTERMEADRARRAAEHESARLAAIVESSQDAIVSKTLDGVIVSWNSAAATTYGYSAAEAIGQPIALLLPDAEAQAEVAAILQRVATGEHTDQIETRRRTKTGQIIDVSLTVSPIRDAEGTVVGASTIGRDITERRRAQERLREAEARFRGAFEQAPIGMALVAPDGTFLRVNRSLCQILGYDATHLLAVGFQALTHPEDLDADLARVRATLAGEIAGYQMQKRYLHRDGRTIWADLSVSLVRGSDGEPLYFVSQIQDVTERTEHAAEQVALRHIAELVAQAAGPAAVFEEVATQLLSLFSGHSGVVVRFDADRKRGVFITGLTQDRGSLAGAELDLTGTSAPAAVFQTGLASRTNGAASVGIDDNLTALNSEITDAVAAPISVAGQLWGCLAASFSGRPAPPGTEERLERFAELVAMAIANTEAWETLSRQASTDAVTGLANHRSFQDRVRSEVTRAHRYHRKLSLVLFDLDHFKHINDTYGHQAGDSVLAEVGARLALQARDTELVARIGGEEFAWLLPESGRDGAYEAAERVRRAIEAQPFPTAGTITISAGICTLTDSDTAEDLVRFADQALYSAKHSGRNTSSLYTEQTHALLAQET